ncbi:hypothetical protein [Nocardioides montaniterrae]
MSTSFRTISAAGASAAAVLAMAVAPAAYATPSSGPHHTSQGKHLGPTTSSAAQVRHPHPHHPNAHAGTGGRAPTHAHGAGAGGAGGGTGGGTHHAPHQAPAGPPKDPAGDPPGNNGTVKIAVVGDADGIPNNAPHPGCTVEVQWFGYDAGSDVISTVTFSPQAPTKGVTIGGVAPTTVAVGGDPASGAGTSTGLDAVQDYALTFSGAAPAKQGYHVRVTVHTPHSLGADTKTKVFWISPCTPTPTPVTPTPTPVTPTPVTPTPVTPTPVTPTPGTVVLPGTPTPGHVSFPVMTPPVVVGPQPAGIDLASAGLPSVNGSSVPTAVDAGSSRSLLDRWAHSPWALAVTGLGVLLTALGVARARRRA